MMTADYGAIDAIAAPPPTSPLRDNQANIDEHFGGETVGDILRSLTHAPDDFTNSAIKLLRRHSPLSLACTVEMIHRIRGKDLIERALELEYRFTYRAAEMGDFVEGIRAAIIDKDRNPKWRHENIEDIRPIKVSKMLMPLGPNTLKL